MPDSFKTWADAAACAVERGGYLTEISSQAEQDTIYQSIVNGAGVPSYYTTVADGGGIVYIWIGPLISLQKENGSGTEHVNTGISRFRYSTFRASGITCTNNSTYSPS
jgi:hypothetical protein